MYMSYIICIGTMCKDYDNDHNIEFTYKSDI